MRGETMVTVSEADVNDTSIAFAPAVTVHGITRVIGSPIKVKQLPGVARALSAAGADANQEGDFDQAIEPACNVSLHQQGGGAHIQSGVQRGRARMAESQDRGAFTIGNVLPGVYNVRVQCYGGYPTSVLSGGVDLLANSKLQIQPGTLPAPIEIQLKPGGGTLSGDFAVRPVPKGAGALLVPAFSNSTGPVMTPIGYNTESQDKIEFNVPFLAPGDYALYAFSDWQHVEFRDPSFLQTLSGGVSVRIEDGKEQQASITKLVK